jgi:hypothetical protein
MLTVRRLVDYLTGLPDDTPVVIDVHDGDSWSLRVEELIVTTAQDATHPVGILMKATRSRSSGSLA